MSFFKMLLVFAPWIAFLVIANGSLFRLKLGIGVAAVLTVVMVVTRLHRGAIMWVGIVFFSFALVAVVLLNNMWTVRNMEILANGALAAGTWMSIALKRPFTLEYAREHTDPSLWHSPLFLRTNYILTLMWAVTFTINATLSWQRNFQPIMPGWGYETSSYSLLVLAMFMSTWYPQFVKRRSRASNAHVDRRSVDLLPNREEPTRGR
jgi:hypothetical protein